MAGKKRRTDIEISKLEDNIFKCIVQGLSKKEIIDKYKISERSYELYVRRIQERLIAEQTEQRREDVLYYKKICEDRLNYALRGEQEIADNQKTTPRTRMDAYMRYGELSMLIFRLQIEAGNWLSEYAQTGNRLDMPKIIPSSEIIEEEEQEPNESEATTEGEQDSNTDYDIPDLDNEDPL